MKKQIAIVYWNDAVIHTSVQLDEDEAKLYFPIRGISVGIIAHETKKFITLAVDWFPKKQGGSMNFKQEQLRQISTIPKACIQRIRRIWLKER